MRRCIRLHTVARVRTPPLLLMLHRVHNLLSVCLFSVAFYVSLLISVRNTHAPCKYRRDSGYTTLTYISCAICVSARARALSTSALRDDLDAHSAEAPPIRARIITSTYPHGRRDYEPYTMTCIYIYIYIRMHSFARLLPTPLPPCTRMALTASTHARIAFFTIDNG